jgi:hypothetical protein
MKTTVLIMLHADDDTQTVVREAFTVQRGALAPETLGLQLEEAKDLLSTVQDTLVETRSPPRWLRRLRARTAESRTVTRTVGPS